jgi:hypothetical protein
MQGKMLKNELLVDKFDPFLGSTKGHKYYKGVLTPDQRE